MSFEASGMTAGFRVLGLRGLGFWGFKVSGLGFRVICVHLGYITDIFLILKERRARGPERRA